MKRLMLAVLLLLVPSVASTQGMQPSYQGLWWKSPAGSESGWGLNIAHQGNILFATWFTYDSDGSGMWLVLPRAELVPSYEERDPYGYDMPGPAAYEYQGLIYRTTGPAFSSTAFDSSAVVATPVGSAVLRFTEPDAGAFIYTIGGLTRTKLIVRQAFGPMPQCELGPGASTRFQDLWWRSPAGSEQGWGVNITHQGDVLFATWFTYGANGRGIWLVMSEGRLSAPGTYTGALYRTTGPAFDASPWNPMSVTVTPVGTATFSFSSADQGTFTYTVDGVSGSKPITRQVFATPATVCR